MRDIDIAVSSACLSVTRWHCVKTAKHIVKILSPSASPISLVFSELIAARKVEWSHH